MATPRPPASKGGRPRGSGRHIGVPAIGLDQAELVPFRAGFRIGSQNPNKWRDTTPLMDTIVIRLTPAERRQLLIDADRHFKEWVIIGLRAAVLQHDIAQARRY